MGRNGYKPAGAARQSTDRNISNKPGPSAGFTLIELILVIVIIGILVGVAVQSGGRLYRTAKIEETRQEMDRLATAIAGNPELQNNGVRTDFGYVGDIGALPPDIDALLADPGGYTTWNGPYISNSFAQSTDDIKLDAWGRSYVLSGAMITSIGSGSTLIRRYADRPAELLANSVSANVYDADGTPPGGVYADSISVVLSHPDGAGGMVYRSGPVDAGGYISFASVPVGNHDLTAVYNPTGDTARGLVSVVPGSTVYTRLRFSSDLWNGLSGGGSGGGLEKVAGSDSLAADCNGLYFYIENTSSHSIDISSITVTYSGVSGYYRYVRWGGAVVVDRNNPQLGSGDIATFSSPQAVASGDTVSIEVDFFKANPTGGANVDVDNATFTIELSDGTSFDVTTGSCP